MASDAGEVKFFPRDQLKLVEDIPGAKLWAVALSRAMLTYFEVEPHARFEEHRHDSEQITLVLGGRLVDAEAHDSVEHGRAGRLVAAKRRGAAQRQGAIAIHRREGVEGNAVKPVHQRQTTCPLHETSGRRRRVAGPARNPSSSSTTTAESESA